MTVMNTEKKIIIMAANGFNENHMTAIQRALTQAKHTFQIVAPEQGLVNGWQDKAWGHYFSVDVSINAVLGSDYDALVVVGGERGIAKLQTNLHSRRIINHFVDANKPLSVIGEGVQLLALADAIAGRKVTAPESAQADLMSAKTILVEDEQVQDGALLTASGEDTVTWAEATVSLIETTVVELDEAA